MTGCTAILTCPDGGEAEGLDGAGLIRLGETTGVRCGVGILLGFRWGDVGVHGGVRGRGGIGEEEAGGGEEGGVGTASRLSSLISSSESWGVSGGFGEGSCLGGGEGEGVFGGEEGR